jgi:2-C-methyl-D-erythritol 2,4-cyclodiphosphate synthase
MVRPRIGFGFDIHRFGDACSGAAVILGGVRISHTRPVLAHSDGDVLVHALCDALLGSLALGDIGHHFPPSDERWRGVDSRELLRQCVQLISERGFELGNADVTVVCEKPKLLPHVDAMRALLASDCKVAIDAISIKATTNEKLDEIGRGEGIAAHAVAMVFPRPLVSVKN